MRVYLCDDEQKMLVNMMQQVKECMPDAEVRMFTAGESLMKRLQKESCDVLLLDIDMPEISGMEVARWAQTLDNRPLLVFVTSHDELVYDSFQYHPFGFIRKGFFEHEIAKVLEACEKELGSKLAYFHFRADGQEIRVARKDICYFEADGNYLKLFLQQGEYRFRSTMAAVENEIGASGFIRIHKGFLVNQAVVRMIGTDEVQLADGVRLPLGKTFAEDARAQFMRYMRG